MTDEEFREKYGRDPVKPGQHTKVKVYWDRIVIALVLLALVVFVIVKAISAIVGAIKGKDDASSVSAAVSSQDDSSSVQGSENANDFQLTVCIDPGHGGEDGGAQDAKATRFEKDDTLKMGLKVRDELEALGVHVVMTRDTDVLVELDDICKTANDAKADLFVSIHRNSAEAHYKGVEIWVNNHEPQADTLLATNILSALDEVGISDNRNVNYGFIGDLQSNYQVNRQTKMPSCLVELGFITNEEDNELLDKNFDAYAKAIAQAVVKTSAELGITDEDGNRIKEGQYLSTKPQWDEKTQTYVTENGDIVYADYIDPDAQDKNVVKQQSKQTVGGIAYAQ